MGWREDEGSQQGDRQELKNPQSVIALGVHLPERLQAQRASDGLKTKTTKIARSTIVYNPVLGARLWRGRYASAINHRINNFLANPMQVTSIFCANQ